jgi:hypothetical protein
MRLARIVAGCAMVAALLLLSSDGLFSQEKKDKEGKVKGQLPSGWSKLNLSAAQKEDVYKVQAEHKEAVDKLKAEIAKLDAELVKKRLAVLNEDQRKKLRELVGGEEPSKEKSKDKDSKDKQ